MGNYVLVDLDALRVGMQVDFREGTAGLGGVITDLDDAGDIVIRSGSAGYVNRFSRADVAAGRYVMWTEVPYAARDCIQYQADACSGAVEMFTPGGQAQPRLRCAHHRAERKRAFNVGMERYAGSDVAPDWYDKSIANEEW
jgi:hypothetical protein